VVNVDQFFCYAVFVVSAIRTGRDPADISAGSLRDQSYCDDLSRVHTMAGNPPIIDIQS